MEKNKNLKFEIVGRSSNDYYWNINRIYLICMSEEIKRIKFGDAIAGLTKVLHIPHCPKCEKRRQILNDIQSLGIKEVVRRLREVGESNTNVTNKDVKKIMKKLEDCC